MDYDLPRQGFLSRFKVPSTITPLKVSRNIIIERGNFGRARGQGTERDTVK